ncbi:MAG: dihydroorotate dehydrogenase electron transfer subunit, partial [Candidatus Micrarchaeia archaeon]
IIENIKAVTLAALKGGADGITAVNTFGPIPTELLSLGKGGMSGKMLKKKGLECIRNISEVVKRFERGEKDKRKITIIAVGGISTAQDVWDYAEYGAEFFGVGSALAGMRHETLRRYFSVLENDLRKNRNDSSRFEFPRFCTDYKRFKIVDIEQVADDMKIFRFDRGIEDANPGQFIFVKVDRHEKPFSIADSSPLVLLVRRVGIFTSRLFELNKGDEVLVRGPYGRGFSTEHAATAVLVGGGCGVAPLLLLAKRLSLKNRKIFVFIGGKTRDQIAFKKEFQALPNCQCFVSTDDGSDGEKGLVTDLLERWLKGAGIKAAKISFYNCGPELMMKRLIEIEKATNPVLVESSVERYTKCGIGLCGSCSIDGLRTCVDGPIFDFNFLSDSEHFGIFRRTASARLTKI